MNKFISNILKESNESIDDFFKPKNLKSREEKYENEKQEFPSKITAGLSKIKNDYKNKKWDSEHEELFLELFSHLHIDEKYDENYNGYFLRNDVNSKRGLFDLEIQIFFMSISIWLKFDNKFNWDYLEIHSFMKIMLVKYFKLNEFSPEAIGT